MLASAIVLVSTVVPATLLFDDDNGALHAIGGVGVWLTRCAMKWHVELLVIVDVADVVHAIQMVIGLF